MAKELGVKPEKMAAVLSRHTRAGDVIVTRGTDLIAQGRIGLQAIGRLFDGQLAPAESPQPLGHTLGGFCHAIGAQELPTLEVPDRPRERGLPEALDTMADVTETEAKDMAITRSDPTVHRERAGKIRLFRSVIAELLVATDLLMDNVSIEERRAAADLLGQYRLVRPAAQASRRLGDQLARVEDYLFGAQEQAAETRAMGQQREQALTDKATKRARLSAESDARKEVADNLSAVLDGFVARRADDKPQVP